MAAAVVGSVVGLLGSAMPTNARLIVGLIMSSAAAVILGIDIWRRVPFPQLERQTQKDWIDQGAARWAVKTGSELGVGVSTRIALPVWFAVPIASFLVGDPLAGAGIWGGYALARAGGSVALAWYTFARNPGSYSELATRLLDKLPQVRSTTDAIGVACAAALVVGLW